MKGLIERYVAQKQGESTSEEEKQSISDYMYQTMMRSGTTEQAIFLLFNPDLHAFLPLGHESKLGSQDFSVPVSFFYGENDWVLFVEEDAGQKCVNSNKNKQSRYHKVANADHNIHMDNPIELSQLILQDLEDL